ncbi:MAG: gamma-glutamyltransferase [Pirellulaceae bacterium]|nr:gamma-glutamyltransferase [Pirellulaceae bacterium]
MKHIFLVLNFAVVLTLCVHVRADPEVQTSTRGMVASGHPLATQAGLNALQSGGNAIDAAVAIGLSLGVVDGHNSGIGGGCFLLIRLANGEFVAIDGRERAPAAATRDMYLRDGKADTTLSQTGSLASGVPGEVAAFDYAVKTYGRKKFSELLLPAAKIAEDGFPISRIYASRLKSTAEELKKFDASRTVFFPNDRLLLEGDVLRQQDLATTYRAIAEHGSDWFYRGEFAKVTDAWMTANHGIMTATDFANYTIEHRIPIQTRYRGHTIVSFPPPSSGGVHVAQMLNILEPFDLKNCDEATRLHLIAEAMKLAFADRAFWLGDPDFVKVPRGLVSTEYAADLAKKIDREHALSVAQHGTPDASTEDIFHDKHTTHFSVADAEGNWVACTATVNTGFGSKVIIPGTGVLLNNQMDDFSVQPGVANFFGLIGAEANAVEPGKRPLSSMSPTIVLKNGEPIIAVGAAGGPRIISAVLMELVAMIELGQSPQQAITAARIHHQWSPNELMFESQLPVSIQKSLEARGHKLKPLSSSSTSQIVARSPDGRSFIGAADPRGGGSTAGW